MSVSGAERLLHRIELPVADEYSFNKPTKHRTPGVLSSVDSRSRASLLTKANLRGEKS